MRNFTRLACAFALALAASAGAKAQTTYPDRPIRMIVGFSAGSATDITARIFAQKLAEAWNVPVTVENLPGAGGSVAAQRAAAAAPDGYTLMYAGYAALAIVPTMQKVGYDPVRDFAPIAITVAMPSILAVNTELPAKTVQELVARAKEQPGKISYASPGIGTPQHLTGEVIKSLAKIDLVHVPYRGAQLADVIGGRVPVTIQAAGAIVGMVREGKLRGLALTSGKRSASIPELPTLAESGFPGFEANSWFALLAPAGTPAAIVQKVNQETLKIVAQPDVRAQFARLALDPVGSSPEQLAEAIRQETPRWAKVIADLGLMPAK